MEMSQCWVEVLGGVPEDDATPHILMLTCSWWAVSRRTDSFAPPAPARPSLFSTWGCRAADAPRATLHQVVDTALASSPASVGRGQAEAGPTPHPGAQQEGALVTHTPAHSLTWTLSTPLPVNPLPHRASWATSQLAPWLKPLPRALPLAGTQAKGQHIALL